MVALMITVVTATFANDGLVDVFNSKTLVCSNEIGGKVNRNYNFALNYDKLASYLELEEDDIALVRYIHDTFCNGMKFASEASTEDSRNKIIFNSINYEIANMSSILSYYQYRKFLRIFNISLVNKGFGDIIVNYEYAKK